MSFSTPAFIIASLASTSTKSLSESARVPPTTTPAPIPPEDQEVSRDLDESIIAGGLATETRWGCIIETEGGIHTTGGSVLRRACRTPPLPSPPPAGARLAELDSTADVKPVALRFGKRA